MIIQKQDYIEMFNEKLPDEFEVTCSPLIDTYVHYKFVNEIFFSLKFVFISFSFFFYFVRSFESYLPR